MYSDTLENREPNLQYGNGHKYNYGKVPPKNFVKKESNLKFEMTSPQSGINIDRVTAGFLVSIGDLVQYVNNCKNILAGCCVDVDWKDVFQMICDERGKKYGQNNENNDYDMLTAEKLFKFLRKSRFQIDIQSINLLIDLFDSSGRETTGSSYSSVKKGLDYDDFESLFVNLDGGHQGKNIYRNSDSGVLSPEIEYLVARYLYNVCRHLKSLTEGSEFKHLQNYSRMNEDGSIFKLISGNG
jgi:hypothetical protein